MSKTATTQGGGTIPAQPGPRDAAGPALRGPDSGIVSAEGDMSDASGPEAHGADSDVVILGAGPTGRPGERATVRLREAAPDDPPRYAPEWLELREGADAGVWATAPMPQWDPDNPIAINWGGSAFYVSSQAQNAELAQRFKIRGYPTVIVLDSSGKKVGQLGYQRGGPAPFIEAIGEM